MTDPAAFTTLISRYHALGRYCDDVFAATLQVWRPHIRCAEGCAACCLLETVVPLEAYVITAYLQSRPPLAFENGATHPDQCVFLYQNHCAIYPVRPLICRTHGLPLAYSAQQTVDACPRNFTEVDLAALDPQWWFDADRLAENLIRLNLAFCLLTQQADAAGERIALRRLLVTQPV